jgi:acetate CoA/acetoacetate CoA-transferase alpha subunit
MSRDKKISPHDLARRFHDGSRILFGGFMGCGTPDGIIDLILDSGAKNLTLIGNDTAFPETGVGRLIAAGRVAKVIASHIGTNPMTGNMMINGTMDVELVPQGTLIERIRCGGAGLGGVLTPTGIGTEVETGKIKMAIDGVEYLVERPLRADISIILAQRGDRLGNLSYQRAARNFNPIIALAADFVVAEIKELLLDGYLEPDSIMTPGALVDAYIASEGENQ